MLAQGGRKKEALALAEEGACKDRLKFMCLEGQEQIGFFQYCVHRELYELVNFFAVGCAQIRNEAFKEGICAAWEGILRAAVPDQNYGVFSVYFDTCLSEQAVLLTNAGQYDEAVARLREVREMWEGIDGQIACEPSSDSDWKHTYTAPLFKDMSVSPVLDKSGRTSYAALFAKKLQIDSRYDPLRDREDFRALCAGEECGENGVTSPAE